MANLIWKSSKGVKALLAEPFKTEEQFEKTVFETSELLEDIFLLKRQIRGGNKPGIPDIIGIDPDGAVCIIEMKNTTVDASIIPQVLQYAMWAETSPDSIKALWLESDERPEDITVEWDQMQVRILVIAPSITPSTLDLATKINYPVDLIEVKRWVEGENEILLVNKLEQAPKPRIRTVAGQPVYDEKFYKTLYNGKSVDDFLYYASELEAFVKKQNWQLQIKFNKAYCGFKAGFLNTFGIKWIGTKTFAFFCKITEEEAKGLPIPMTKYDSQWKEAVYYIEPSKTKIQTMAPVLKLSYHKITGK